eukprot:3275088-Alexandrium_andersonii.AAC.1
MATHMRILVCTCMRKSEQVQTKAEASVLKRSHHCSAPSDLVVQACSAHEEGPSAQCHPKCSLGTALHP